MKEKKVKNKLNATNKTIALINGPNLGILGKRQTGLYGTKTLLEITSELKKLAEKSHFELLSIQSNHEGELIDFIESLDSRCAGCIINPGALMMSGYSLMDAIAGSTIPFVEVHISNIYRRESFRHKSVLSAVCEAHVTGFGQLSYNVAFDGLIKLISTK